MGAGLRAGLASIHAVMLFTSSSLTPWPGRFSSALL